MQDEAWAISARANREPAQREKIILTHLDFLQVIEGADPYPDSERDLQCFGDVISIFNLEGTQDAKFFDQIWINHSTFRNCGDECIGVTRNSKITRARVSLSHNDFGFSFKGLLIGASTDHPHVTAVSIYGNRFVRVSQRSPRVENQYVHAFNNLFDNFSRYAIGLFRDARVIAEHNVFLTTNQSPIRKYTPNTGRLWHRNNFRNSAVLDSPSDPAFFQSRGDWLYDPALAKPITPSTHDSFISDIRASAGWQRATNDAR
jgi:pectate lyase